MKRRAELERVAREHGLLSVYLFGSRADDGLMLLEDQPVAGEGSDLDVGVVYRGREEPEFRRLGALQVGFEDVFDPLPVDLVPLQRVDALFQFQAMDQALGSLLPTPTLPIQRRLEEETFGVSTA